VTQPKLRVAIMADELGWHTRQLQAALRKRGAVGRCIDLAHCHINTQQHRHGLALPGFADALPHAVLVRGIAGGTFEQVTRRLSVLHALREAGVPVYNDARAIERSVDKGMSSLLLRAAGINTPFTWVMESHADAQRLVMRESAARRGLVLKPLFGSQGKDLMRVAWVDGQHVPLPALTGAYHQVAYLQRFVSPLTTPGFDWRVLVVGGRARAAMRRVSAHWVHNVAQGARCESAELTAPLARAAEAAALALGLDYAGVDLMPDDSLKDGGWGAVQVIEVNGVAAWQGLQRVTPFNIAQALVDDLIDRKLARSEQAQQQQHQQQQQRSA
jgi:tetrahydromethanopterin:alpha-L-glutamate ligase